MIDTILLLIIGFMFGYIFYEFIHRFESKEQIVKQPDKEDMEEFCKDIHPTPVPKGK
jgi:hypothetical protein